MLKRSGSDDGPGAVPAAVPDDPHFDATDAAHPAWWRGHDFGIEAMRRVVRRALREPPVGGSYASDAACEIDASVRALRAERDALRAAPVIHRITFDPRADAAYLYLREIAPGGAVRTVSVGGGVGVDFGPDGALLGVEVLSARMALPADILARAVTIGGAA